MALLENLTPGTPNPEQVRLKNPQSEASSYQDSQSQPPQVTPASDQAIGLFKNILAPLYLDSAQQSPKLLFDAHGVNFYRGAGNIESGGVNLYIMHAIKNDVYGSALFNIQGSNLDGLSLSRSGTHTTEMELIISTMKAIRINLAPIVREYSIEPLTLLSALPTRQHQSNH